MAGAASEKSHAIRLGEVSTKVENVAIPTIQFQNLKGSWGIACEIGGGLSNDVDPHQHTGPHWYGGRRRARGPGCGARGRRRHRRQPNLAHNLSRLFFETPQKRCNSNDANSMFQ